MAYVYRQSGSKYFTAAFKTPSGQWMRRTTKLVKESEALRLSFLWQGAGATLALETPTGAQIDKVVREVWERFSGKRLELTPTRTFLQGWLQRVRASRSAGTADRYGMVIADFLEHLGARADLDIRAVTGAEVQAFIDGKTQTGLSGATVNLNAKVLRAAFNAAVRAEAIEKNPAGALNILETVAEQREPFTLGELNALLAATKGTDWETAVLLGAFAGLRLGDAVTMQWEAVDLAKKMLVFVPQKTRRSKKELRVPIHPRLYAHLNALASQERAQHSPLLCPSFAGRDIGGKAGLSAGFMAIMEKAGVDAKRTAERAGAGHAFSKKSFHSLRYFFVSGMANRGVASDVMRKLAGHASEAMTSRYSQLEDKTLRAAIAKLPGGGRSK